MDITLRPLNLGEILDRTFHLYRMRFLMFVGIALFAAAIDLLWRAFQVVALRTVGAQHVSSLGVSALTAGMGFVSAFITLIVLALTFAATTRAVSALHLGANTGVAQAYSEVRPHWFRYVLVNLCAFLLAWLPAILVIAALALAISLRSGPVAIAALGLAIVIAVPLGIWMMIRYSLANAASVSEQIGVRKALRRSVELSKSRRGPLFVGLLVTVAAQALLGMVLLTPLGLLFFIPHAAHSSHLLLPTTIYALAMRFVSNSLCMPIYGILLTLFYYDARIRKEGFDIEWMLERTAQAAGMPRAGALPRAGFEPL